MRLAGADLDRVTAHDTDEDTELAAVCRIGGAERRPTAGRNRLMGRMGRQTATITVQRPSGAGSGALLPLQRAAVGVLLITHTRKMAPEGNPLDTVSGSRQVTAAPADGAGSSRISGVHQTKGNLGGKGPRDRVSDIETAVLKTADGGDIETPRMVMARLASRRRSKFRLANDRAVSVDDVCRPALTAGTALPNAADAEPRLGSCSNVQDKSGPDSTLIARAVDMP